MHLVPGQATIREHAARTDPLDGIGLAAVLCDWFTVVLAVVHHHAPWLADAY